MFTRRSKHDRPYHTRGSTSKILPRTSTYQEFRLDSVCTFTGTRSYTGSCRVRLKKDFLYFFCFSFLFFLFLCLFLFCFPVLASEASPAISAARYDIACAAFHVCLGTCRQYRSASAVTTTCTGHDWRTSSFACACACACNCCACNCCACNCSTGNCGNWCMVIPCHGHQGGAQHTCGFSAVNRSKLVHDTLNHHFDWILLIHSNQFSLERLHRSFKFRLAARRAGHRTHPIL
jgi:hypothetical protein